MYMTPALNKFFIVGVSINSAYYYCAEQLKGNTVMRKTILAPVIIMLMLLGMATAPVATADHGKAAGKHKPAWKESLTKQQKDTLRVKKVTFLKKKLPAKARMKTIKTELAVLSIADKPDQEAINKKIDELLALKKDLLRAKYAHIASVRKELAPNQQAMFDKWRLKKAKRGKCHRKHGHH